jgi:hypothetical protein
MSQISIKTKTSKNNRTQQNIRKRVKHQNKTKHFSYMVKQRTITFWTPQGQAPSLIMVCFSFSQFIHKDFCKDVVNSMHKQLRQHLIFYFNPYFFNLFLIFTFQSVDIEVYYARFDEHH